MDCGPYFPTAEADACALSARLAALRAFARDVAEAVQALQLPQTYLEAERAARAVMVADRFVGNLREETLGGEEVRYPSTAEAGGPPPQQAGAEKEGDEEEKPPTTIASAAPPPHAWGTESETLIDETDRLRLRLRVYADRVMQAATLVPKPDNFLEVVRAGRYGLACERMLTQLYVRPKTKAPHSGFADYAEDDEAPDHRRVFSPRSKGVDPEDLRHDWADWQFTLEEKLDKAAVRVHTRAEDSGFWPDGKPYVADLIFEGPQRFNPDGSVLCTLESLRHHNALYKAAQDAANAAHGWSPPPDPP